MHALPGSRAGYCRTATMTSSSSSSSSSIAGVEASSATSSSSGGAGSSSIAGVDARPAWKPSWPLPHRHHDQQQQQ
ncbi:hypothetical protein PR002_g33102 [Phytophthora rubi]|uniref:Uncharacterized protein n=1 Tax=Phytophthora rubi TaxID=129364 RepID=A0A6A3G2V0_9STRA|nr:hypothetical protein PR002_g33102 [Phytophthora rubi]